MTKFYKTLIAMQKELGFEFKGDAYKVILRSADEADREYVRIIESAEDARRAYERVAAGEIYTDFGMQHAQKTALAMEAFRIKRDAFYTLASVVLGDEKFTRYMESFKK